jgi:hypothetical protein
MIEYDLQLRSALRASFDAIEVPPMPSSVSPRFAHRPRPAYLPNSAPRWSASLLAAAMLLVAIGVTFRAQGVALAQSFEQTLSFFVRANDRTVPAGAQRITFNAALQTPDFRVVRPSGVPAGANFVAAQRFSSAGSSPIIVFSYRRAGHEFQIIETHEREVARWNINADRLGPEDGSKFVKVTSACNDLACAGDMALFRNGSTTILVIAERGALKGRDFRTSDLARIQAAMQRE